MKNMCRLVGVLLTAFCLLAVVSSRGVAGDIRRPAGNLKQQCERANAATEARFQTVVSSWRQHVTDLRSLTRLKRVAADAVAFEEKVAQGFDLFETPTGRVDRMRQSFRKHVADERVLAKTMSEAFSAWQQELMTETITLYGNAGISKSAAQSGYPARKLDPAQLERAFDPVVRKANDMASEDWFRFALVNAGSTLVAEGIEEIGRNTGTWNAEEGSFGDFLAGLIFEMAADVALDTVTDPTEQFATELQTSMVAAERSLLDGPSGLITAMRNLATVHQQGRLKHLGLTQNGGRK